MRSASVRGLSPSGEVPSWPDAFAWDAVPDASAYRVRVLGVDDAVVLERTVERPEWSPDEEARTSLRTAVLYGWTVEALDAGGEAIASSERVTFRIRP